MIKISFSMLVGGGDFGMVDGIAHYITIQVGSFTTVCLGGMVGCIPTGETTTTTTCGEAIDGTTIRYLMVMFEPTGKLGTTRAIINRIGALPAATVREWRRVGTSEAFHKRQDTNRLQGLRAGVLQRQEAKRLQEFLPRVLRRQKGYRLQWLLARVLWGQKLNRLQ